MRKITALITMLIMLLSFSACNAPAIESEESPTPTATLEPQETIVFADPVLEAMVRGTMGKPEGAITAADAEAVRRLDLNLEWERYTAGWMPIKDLGGLEYFKNLEYLDLSDHAITDVTPLAGLNKLTLLALGGNPIADIAPLAGLTNLKALILSGCAAQDYSPLANLTSLELLMLNNSTITDATPLASLINLTRLYLAGCELDYSPLANIYPNLEDGDFVIKPVPTTLAELGFYMDSERNQAIYDTDQVSVRINHEEWGYSGEEWTQNSVRTVLGTDEYKVDIGYDPKHDVYVVMAFHDGGFVLNYLFHPADGSFGFNVGDRESSETHVRAIFPDAAGEDLLLAPIDYHTAALEDVLGMTATELFAMPFESISLKSLGFVENEEVPGWLYVYNDSGDYFDLSIHDPKQEAWEGGGEVRFYMPLSEEYRIVVTYHIDEKRFTVKADDNNGGGAEYRFLIDSNELVDIWCSDDSLTVEQYFMKAIDDPSITDTYDIYHYAIKLMVGAVEGTFGMGIEELYALPID